QIYIGNKLVFLYITLGRNTGIFMGKLFDSTITDEGTWTLENEYAADPWVQDQMQRKLTLERFQRENPGFDFSGAEISGNYSKGGPDFSSLEK
uniref:NudC domain containing 2 n=1 Tax=Bubo bubo TaxID=30461 RepID=A0A8C0FIU4_BUBBB